VDLPALFRGEGPLELEIGPGRGAFILERCAAVRDACILGLEIRRKWATKVDERLEREGLHHRARVVCEDARVALARLSPDASVRRVFIHFPDPWWKKRHQKRLVIVDPLIAEVVRLLEDEGELFVQTDVPERAEQYAEVIGASQELRPAGDSDDSPVVVDTPYGALSNRERRAVQDGLPVYRMRYRRRTRGVTSSSE
jgi:tRNA (guanine-N7-)-methyltransferase